MVLLKKKKGNQYFSETVCSKEKVTTFEFEKTQETSFSCLKLQVNILTTLCNFLNKLLQVSYHR